MANRNVKVAPPPITKVGVWEGSDPTGWWATEKLDGNRAYWDGWKLISRRGAVLQAPSWFTELLPQGEALDGELWAGRGNYEKVNKATASKRDPDPHWRHLTYMVFDAPEARGNYLERLNRARYLVGYEPYVDVVEPHCIDSVVHMARMLAEVEAQGGEGLVIRDLAAPYQEGDGGPILKVRSFWDGEAVVVKHLERKGVLSALQLETASGDRFLVTQGVSPLAVPDIGSVLTYRCDGLTAKGIPRSGAMLIRARPDMAPGDIGDPQPRSPFEGAP